MASAPQPPTQARSRRGLRRSWAHLPVYAYLIALALFAVGPLTITWMTAFKSGTQIIFDPFGLPNPIRLDNLIKAWEGARFSTYFGNSLIISVSAVLGMVVVSSLAGYAFGRMQFAGKRPLMLLFLLGLTIPVTAIIIPLYLTMRDVGLLNSYGSVIVAHVALGAPIFIFIMRAFFRGLPAELDDAARVEGCSEFQVFRHVMLPLARPGLMTVALLEFLWSWNSLLLPLVFLTTDDVRTMPVGLLLFQGRTSVNWGLMSSGVLLMSIPVVILFLLFQRRFIQGLISGSVKG